jgi:hypothetical protein
MRRGCTAGRPGPPGRRAGSAAAITAHS